MRTDVRPERDRAVDRVRAVAIAGVVGGHWLVTGLVVDDDGSWRQASPLAAMPAFAPVSWLLQTLGLFFFAGGFGAARSSGSRPPTAALVRPLAVLLGLWTAVLTVAWALGTPAVTVRTIAVLVVSPLWFLLPYLLLRALTGPLTRLVDRGGPLAVAGPAVVVVAVSDAGYAPPWPAVPAAWSVPWVLGIAAARGRRLSGLALLLSGAAGMVLLVRVAGYPASAVGVPGDGRSNLDPPSLFTVALAAAQVGVFVLVRHRLTAPNGRLTRSLNRAALPIYLSHQSVLVTAAAIGGNSLLRPPTDLSWIALRAAWLPFLALALAAVTAPRWRTTRRARAD